MDKRIARTLLAATVALATPHVAGATEVPAKNQIVMAEQIDDTSIAASLIDNTSTTRDGNVTTIDGPYGVTTLTEDVAANTITIESPKGKTVLDREETLSMGEKGIADPMSAIQPMNVVTDWRAYLCSAATSAVVGGHGAAWQAALKVIETAGKAHPITRIALAVGHFGADVFISTQC